MIQICRDRKAAIYILGFNENKQDNATLPLGYILNLLSLHLNDRNLNTSNGFLIKIEDSVLKWNENLFFVLFGSSVKPKIQNSPSG